MNHYEYRVCQVQQGRVTFVNSQWQGSIPLEKVTSGQVPLEEGLATCMLEWEYLQAAGAHGWELVCVVPSGELRLLYLRRETN